MKKDQSQDKYKEITQKLKEEKMNWDFQDFLEKTKQENQTIPFVKKSNGGTFPKIFWLAASVLLLFSIGLFFNYGYKNNISENDQLVQNEIKKQKDTFQQESNLAVNLIHDTLKVKADTIISDSARTVEQINEADIMDHIVPRRGRINRNERERYAETSSPKESQDQQNTANSSYQSSYVMINGQEIKNEQEAIDLTKYSFRILSENVSKTVAQTEVIKSFTHDN